MDLSDWRVRIDELDRQILDLLNERARCVVALAPLKRRDAVPVHEPKREADVLAKMHAHNKGPLSSDAVHKIFERIMEVMRAVQLSLPQTNGGRVDAPSQAEPAQTASSKPHGETPDKA